MIKLYGNLYSRANRIRRVFEASGTAYEEETVPLGADGTGAARLLVINATGLIPVIDNDGQVLFELVPICLYIAKNYAPTSEQDEVSHCLTMLEQAIRVNDLLVAERLMIADLIVSEVPINLIRAGLTER